MRPIQIKRDKEASAITISWDDGHTSLFPLSFLRDECPCAGCKGEVIFGTVYKPAPLSIFKEGMYELRSLTTVGQYAVQASWGDGHDTGIYSWEYLLALETTLRDAVNQKT